MKQDFLFVLQTYLIGLVIHGDISPENSAEIAFDGTRLKSACLEHGSNLNVKVVEFTNWRRNQSDRCDWARFE